MIKSYVTRAGRYTKAQKKAYESLSDSYIIPFCESFQKLDCKKIFNNTNDVILEIGFGMGIATAAIAKENPCKNYVGIEVHRPGVGRLLREIQNCSLQNVRIIEHDAVSVMQNMILPESLNAIHIFFPDPWPKKKHHKRRLIQHPFTETLAFAIKPGGYFYMATDWEDYAKKALSELSNIKVLHNAYEGFAPHQKWRPVTNFEQKGIAKNHKIKEIYFIKRK